jgi:hypothetical protein
VGVGTSCVCNGSRPFKKEEAEQENYTMNRCSKRDNYAYDADILIDAIVFKQEMRTRIWRTLRASFAPSFCGKVFAVPHPASGDERGSADNKGEKSGTPGDQDLVDQVRITR